MKRRTFIIGAASVTAGGAAAMGSGAFSSVEAERTVSVELNDDMEAYLGAKPLDDNGEPANVGREPIAQDDPYAVIHEETGRIVLAFDALNNDAETVISDVFRIRNQGTQEVGIFLEKEGENPEVVEFYADDDRLDVDEDDAVRIEPGEHLDVTVEFDTFGIDPEDDIMHTLFINGDAEAGTS